LRSLLAIIIVTAISAQAISKLVILINFQLNKEYIAKNLCEKKEEQDNCCQGTCHLKKQLAEDEERNNEATNSGKLKFEKTEYWSEFLSISLYKNLKEKFVSNYSGKILSGFKSKLLRPPGAVPTLV
jgi:hypothetical protein